VLTLSNKYSQKSFTNKISLSILVKIVLFDKALVSALACGALAMCAMWVGIFFQIIPAFYFKIHNGLLLNFSVVADGLLHLAVIGSGKGISP
jgi:hypothetical protein